MGSLLFHGLHNNFLQWDEWQFAVWELSTSYLENPWDKCSLEYLRLTPQGICNIMTMGPICAWRCIFHSLSRELFQDHMEGIHCGYSAKMAFSYHISKHSASSYGSFVGRGANSSIAGADVHILERTG